MVLQLRSPERRQQYPYSVGRAQQNPVLLFAAESKRCSNRPAQEVPTSAHFQCDGPGTPPARSFARSVHRCERSHVPSLQTRPSGRENCAIAQGRSRTASFRLLPVRVPHAEDKQVSSSMPRGTRRRRAPECNPHRTARAPTYENRIPASRLVQFLSIVDATACSSCTARRMRRPHGTTIFQMRKAKPIGRDHQWRPYSPCRLSRLRRRVESPPRGRWLWLPLMHRYSTEKSGFT